MKNEILKSFVTCIATVIFTILLNLIITLMTIDKSMIQIGNSIKLDSDKYQFGIDILSFSDYNISKLRLQIPETLTTDNIIVNQPINITKIETKSKDNSTVFEIERVPENQNVHLIIQSPKSINTNNVLVDKNNNKIKVESINQIKSPFKNSILSMLINSLIYGILLGLFIYFIEYKRLKDNKKFEEEYTQTRDYYKSLIESDTKHFEDKIKQEKQHFEDTAKQDRQHFEDTIAQYNTKANEITAYNASISKEVSALEKELTDIKNSSMKNKLLLLSRLNDYKTELEFWRDTVRKILYTKTQNEDTAEVLINSVTDTLKTYQTNTKSQPDFKTIEYLSNLIANDKKI